MNGNDIVEFIESKNGSLEEEFIGLHDEEFMVFVLDKMNGVRD